MAAARVAGRPDFREVLNFASWAEAITLCVRGVPDDGYMGFTLHMPPRLQPESYHAPGSDNQILSWYIHISCRRHSWARRKIIGCMAKSIG